MGLICRDSSPESAAFSGLKGRQAAVDKGGEGGGRRGEEEEKEDMNERNGEWEKDRFLHKPMTRATPGDTKFYLR